MAKRGSLSSSPSDPSESIDQLLTDVAERRFKGETVPDAALIAAHSELMPELEERLKALRRVEAARKNAQAKAAEAETPAETVSTAASDVELTPEAAAPPEPSASRVTPDLIPGYQILNELHRGGQGVVYRAIQKSTKRKVAIKVMKEGPFAGAADKARFEREVLILGQLKHPNIVTVYDSGTAAGSAYFVMDYISGQSLDVYMADVEHSIDDTLKLFAKICEAMNAAHLRGVIHRDLKPGNIRIDDEGQPHILDFGLAKVAASDAEGHAMTMTGQFIGSLPWSSPEQAEAKPGKIDIRTDVYSLGVILYQMLTGKFPYDVIGNMRDVLDRIIKAEPARPSTIRKQINDEVETIVLKCLSKQRERRYQSAGELAADIRCYLQGEPIRARRDSLWYLVRKRGRAWTLRSPIARGSMVVVVAMFLAQLIGVPLVYLWTPANRWFEQTATRLVPPLSRLREFQQVRLVVLTDETDIVALSERFGLGPETYTDRRGLRGLHGLLMQHLARGRPRVVAWDIRFASSSPFDQQFLEGVHALKENGTPVVVGVADWSIPPLLNPEFLPHVRWGALMVDFSGIQPWAIEVAVKRRDQDLQKSLALETVAAFWHPELESTVELVQRVNHLSMRYFQRNPAAPADQFYYGLTNVLPFTASVLRTGPTSEGDLRAGDRVCFYRFQLPSQQAYAAATIPYERVFDATPEQLLWWFEDHVVLIGDLRANGDVRLRHADGRTLPGAYGHAAAIESALRTLGVRLPPTAHIAPLVLLGAATGLVIGVRWALYWRKRVVGLVVTAATFLAASLLVYYITRYLCNPAIPLLAACICSELAGRSQRWRGSQQTEAAT